MKKIVAIVLSLVMVLGLATTAFAATVPQWVLNGTEGFDVYDGNNVKLNETETGVMVTYNPAVTPSAKNEYMGNVAFYTLDTDVYVFAEKTTYYAGTTFVLASKYEKGAIAVRAHSDKIPQGEDYYSVLSQTVPGATYFLVPATVYYNWTADVFSAFGTKCGNVVEPDFVALVGEYDVVVRWTKTFAANDPVFPGENIDAIIAAEVGTNDGAYDYANFMVNGKIYTAYVAEAVSYVQHTWAASEYSEKDGAVTKYTCANCKVVGTVVASPFLAPADAEIEQLANLTYVYFYTTATPVAGDTVESAKTFDAGIAMYVGMSVMAAAGSAVVLKKKD